MKRLVFALLLAAWTMTCAAQPRPLLPAGEWILVRQNEDQLRVEPLTADALPPRARDGLRITVLKRTDPFYHLQVGKDVPSAIAGGTRIRLSFFARSRTNNPVRVVVEKVGPPYTAVVELNLALGPQWQRYVASGIAPQFPPRGMALRIQVGHQEGELEMADIALTDEGQDPAVERARAAVQPDAVERRIREHRTGMLRIQVTHRSGKPVAGASVSVEQTRHAFLFGSNIFHLNPADISERQKLYQERFAALLNYATLPFYWGSFEYERGNKQYAKLDAMAKWCQAHGIVTKGHPLVWHEVYPSWAPAEPDQAIPLLEARVREIIGHYRGLITYWDVVNEANNSVMYPRTGVGQWARRDGPVKMVATALRWAREASRGTNNVLLYNDFNITDANVQLLSGLQQGGMLPDAIGIQSHMHGGTWPMEKVWEVVDRFAAFGKPIHFTEVTVLSGPAPSPGQSTETTEEGERRQADYVERFYSVLFSHPSVEAITWWDFSDWLAWQGAPAGFLRKDMSPKPVYDRLMALIKGRWWTNVRGKTDANGTFGTRAFQGEYRITVTDASGKTKTVTAKLPLRAKSASVRVVLD